MPLSSPRPRRHVRLQGGLQPPDARASSPGFVLPLATLMSLLLLLGSLSVQAVSLQGRLRGVAERELQTAEDQLISAAQLLVGRLQVRHACLLPLPMEQWPAAGCASAEDLAQLRQGSVLGASWRLLHWRPDAGLPGMAASQPPRLMLELALSSQGSRPARRAAFAVQLLGPPWWVRELRPLGLRGESS